MSDNPFNDGYTKGFYSTFVLEQIKNLKVGESIKADFGTKKKSNFRSMLTYSAASIGIGVKTKSGANNSVWVVRVH
tara:strand:+ start:300 stop:527 length:228 start_codon:yes stop_codon:yes gene_type:complete